MISLYCSAVDEVDKTPCLCGGFVQDGVFTHAEACTRIHILAVLRDLRADVWFVFPGAATSPHAGAEVTFGLRWSSVVDVVRNRKGQLRSLIRTRDGSRIILTRAEHAALRYAGDAILRRHHDELYP